MAGELPSVFDDLPNTISPVTVGGYLLDYAKHHVIPTTVYNGSDFLKQLQAMGLWNQNSFATNGVALVSPL